MKQKYVQPRIMLITRSEILEALGPASARCGMSPGGGWGGWGVSDDDDDGDDD
jgi:hypothetical protein